MLDAEFSAYVEGLPPQDRRTVEQALHGLRHAMRVRPRTEIEAEGRRRVCMLLEAVRTVTRRDAKPPFWRSLLG